MALRIGQPSDQGEVEFPGLSDAQFGSIVEERVDTAFFTQAPGSVSSAFPAVDLGVDRYLRRPRTLRVHPLQIKGRSFLLADGLFEASFSTLVADPRGYVVLPYVPPPAWQLDSRMFVIPIPEFLRIARRHRDGYLLFSAHLDVNAGEPASRFLVDTRRLEAQWLRKIPGWTAPIEPLALAAEPIDVPKRAARSFGKAGELWLISQLMGTALDSVAIAQDRLRLDCVDLLLHDLTSFAVLGLAVHSSSVDARGHVQFRNRSRTFFEDSRLFVVLLVYRDSRTPYETAFLIPSSDVPRVLTASTDHDGDPGFQANFRLEPLAEKMRPYAVPTADLAQRILDRLRGAA